jgi:pimeloyl-ACP methyl ester carboxylesterase
LYARFDYSLARVSVQPAPILAIVFGCLAWAGSSPGLATEPRATAEQSLTLRACQLEDSLHVSVVPADCGQLSVPEDPADPKSRRISLWIARVPAISRRKQPDPLFVLAGGPGQAATVFYASTATAFGRVHRDRDIILVDQRGTGRSNPLTCTLSDEALSQASDEEIASEAKGCARELAGHADIRLYTSSIAVRDLDLVRASLGYARINLYGVSYGTRVAQHYIRRFPDRVRSVVLDGVVPPQLILGPATALDAEAALTRILARCRDDADCRARFGDPADSYRALRGSLQAHAIDVSLPDPTSGLPAKLQFGRYQFATVLRLASYTSEQSALLPLMLHQASAAADFAPMAAQFLLVTREYTDVLAYGMHNTVICSEDAPFYDRMTVDRTALEATYLGTSQFDGLRSICAVWQRGPVDDDFHADLRTDVPVLLLSGSDDPVTPPADAETARRYLSHSLHLVLQGFGHGQITAPCVGEIIAKFLDRASVDGLDVRCAQEDKPLPFFTSLGGPSP